MPCTSFLRFEPLTFGETGTALKQPFISKIDVGLPSQSIQQHYLSPITWDTVQCAIEVSEREYHNQFNN